MLPCSHERLKIVVAGAFCAGIWHLTFKSAEILQRLTWICLLAKAHDRSHDLIKHFDLRALAQIMCSEQFDAGSGTPWPRGWGNHQEMVNG